MHFRHFKASDLETATELPGIPSWLSEIGPGDASVLIFAPAGSGKTAAVGSIARVRKQDVVLSNLMELLEHPDAERQLQNLLLLCESQRNSVLFLERLDSFLDAWDARHPEAAGRLAEVLRGWLEQAKERLAGNHTLLVATGREIEHVPSSLRQTFDRTLAS